MRFKILVLLTFVVISCKTKTKVNPNVLSKNQMISILIDVHVLESKIGKLSIRKDSGTWIFNTFEREIFEAHQIDKEKYIKSYRYYMEETEGMNEIYTAVVDSLNFMQKAQEMEKKNKEDIEKEKKEGKKRLKEEKKVREDSLAKLAKAPQLITPKKELIIDDSKLMRRD